MMTEKRFESRYNSRDGEYWLFDNKYDSCLLILNSDIQLHNLIILLNQMNEENEQLTKELKNRSAFIIDKGLGDTFVRWKNE